MYGPAICPPREELADLLVTGPFSDALRAAIQVRGLSLERIQHRLRVRGAPISITALSYWQSGRRRPERPESMTALSHLEDVLDLPGGALSRLLGPPKPRGRARSAANSVPLGQPSDLAVISQHDRVEITRCGATRAVRSRQVLRTDLPGIDRWMLLCDTDAPGARPPEVNALRSCRVGRLACEQTSGIMLAELLFDQPLEPGIPAVIEYEVGYPEPPYPNSDNTHFRRFRHRVRDYVLEIKFDPGHLPRRCEQFTSSVSEGVLGAVRPVPIDGWGYAHAVTLNFGPGVFGMRWEWI